MTLAQREIIVERYLAGEMSASEEQEFFMKVATDGDLFRTLRAHRMVERALDRDRDAIPAGYMAIQEKAMELLAAQSPAVTATLGTASAAFGGLRLGTWITLVSTAVLFSAAGFITHGLVNSPADEQHRPVQPAAARATSEAGSGIVTPAPTPRSQVRDRLVGAADTTISSHLRSSSSSVGELAQQNPARRAEQQPPVHMQPRMGTSTFPSDRGRRDSSKIVEQKLPPAEHRVENTPVVSAPAEEFSRLPHDRDSVTFRMRIMPPKKEHTGNP
jgi:hypothetical protein